MAIAIGTLLVDHATADFSVPTCCTRWPAPMPETASPLRPPRVACRRVKLARSAFESTARDTDVLALRAGELGVAVDESPGPVLVAVASGTGSVLASAGAVCTADAVGSASAAGKVSWAVL